MAGIAAPDDLAGGGVESGEQAEGSGARVVVRAPLDLAWAHRQQGLRSIERLNLALFSSTHRTNARSGGDRYSPTMSRTFSTNKGAGESLNVSVRGGWRWTAFHSR